MTKQQLINLRLQSREQEYWLFQVAGWTAFTVLSYFSLTIWYNPGQWPYLMHTIVQSVIGLFLSHPLRMVATRSWNLSPLSRILINGLAITLIGTIWTACRLVTLTWLTGEQIAPSDWGGWLNASLIVYGAWAFCYHAIKYYRQWTEQRDLALLAQKSALEAKSRAQEESYKRLFLENEQQSIKLRMLKYQLNPHFLFNSLNSVSALVQRGSPEEATDMLARIADLLRISLDDDDELTHTISEELDMIALYLSIEKVRFKDRLQVQLSVTEDAKKVQIPSFLLQPIFENAIKYAVGKTLLPTEVNCDIRIDGYHLMICVSDTGPGLDQTENSNKSQSTGIGLKNVEERLSAHYGDRFQLRLSENTPQGARVELSIPVSTDITTHDQID